MIKFVQRVRSAVSHLRCLRKDERGVAALEFAMISPLLITLFFGTVEVSQAIAADRKATLLARTLGDLVSQYSNVSNSDINNIFLAGTAVMTPYAAGATQLKSVITAVNIDASGKATVAWSDTKTGNDSTTLSTQNLDHKAGDTVAIPSALATPSTELIWSEVTYTYKSPISHFIIGNKLLKEQNYVRPRQTSTVTRSVS